jgi:DNA-binding NarL/FixJ family response regulator
MGGTAPMDLWRLGGSMQAILAAPASAPAPLTAREWEITSYLVAGRLNKEIARALGLSHQTVKNHIQHISAKLQVANRTQIAVWGMRHGLVPD